MRLWKEELESWIVAGCIFAVIVILAMAKGNAVKHAFAVQEGQGREARVAAYESLSDVPDVLEVRPCQVASEIFPMSIHLFNEETGEFSPVGQVFAAGRSVLLTGEKNRTGRYIVYFYEKLPKPGAPIPSAKRIVEIHLKLPKLFAPPADSRRRSFLFNRRFCRVYWNFNLCANIIGNKTLGGRKSHRRLFIN